MDSLFSPDENNYFYEWINSRVLPSNNFHYQTQTHTFTWTPIFLSFQQFIFSCSHSKQFSKIFNSIRKQKIKFSFVNIGTKLAERRRKKCSFDEITNRTEHAIGVFSCEGCKNGITLAVLCLHWSYFFFFLFFSCGVRFVFFVFFPIFLVLLFLSKHADRLTQQKGETLFGRVRLRQRIWSSTCIDHPNKHVFSQLQLILIHCVFIEFSDCFGRARAVEITRRGKRMKKKHNKRRKRKIRILKVIYACC